MLEIMASRAWDPDPPEVLLRVRKLHAVPSIVALGKADIDGRGHQDEKLCSLFCYLLSTFCYSLL